MHAILNSVLDGANWLADGLDTLLTDAVLGFGAAAPIIVERDCEASLESRER